MLTALICFLCVLIFDRRKGGEEKIDASSDPVNLDACASSGSANYDNIYNSDVLFEIYGIPGLHLFRDMVNSGYSFENRAIIFRNDIDYKNAEWTPIGTSNNPFRGAFISGRVFNLKITNNVEYAGFFGKIEGDISYLEIDNFKMSAKKIVHAGGLAGYASGSIKNCKISNLNIKITEFNNLQSIGGIAGDCGNVTIENCEVNQYDVHADMRCGARGVGGLIGATKGSLEKTLNVNIKLCGVRNMRLSGSYTICCGGVGGLVGYANYAKNVYINDCAFINLSIEKVTYWGTSRNLNFAALIGCGLNTPENIYICDCIVLNFFDVQYFASVNSYTGGKNCHIANVYCNMKTLSNELGYEDMKLSAIENFSYNKNSWYIPQGYGYNDGWPYLSNFVEWDTIDFKAEEHGKVDTTLSYNILSLVTKDTDDSVITYSELDAMEFSTKPTHSVKGNVITAVPNEGYRFYEWIRTDNIFYAKFRKEEYRLRFEVVDENWNPVEGIVKGPTSWVTYGDVLGSFYGKPLYSIYWDWYAGDYMLCRDVPAKYTLYWVSYSGEMFYEGDSIIIKDLGEHEEEYVVYVCLKLKTYGVEVG